MYKLLRDLPGIQSTGVQRLADGAFIPADLANKDWREYTRWVLEGNLPAPADPPTDAELDAAILGQMEQLTLKTLLRLTRLVIDLWQATNQDLQDGQYQNLKDLRDQLTALRNSLRDASSV